jgi:hypothetical protein
MHAIIDTLRESFTPYLAFGVVFSAASVWAAVKAIGAEPGKAPGDPRS